jgi:hypothetical protein
MYSPRYAAPGAQEEVQRSWWRRWLCGLRQGFFGDSSPQASVGEVSNRTGKRSPSSEKEVVCMRRIMMVVTVWLVMVAMMLVIALPVIAKNTKDPDEPAFTSGFGNPGTSSVVGHSDETKGVCVTHQGDTMGKLTGAGCEETTE